MRRALGAAGYTWTAGNAASNATEVSNVFYAEGFADEAKAVAEALITRIHREAVGGAPDEATVQLLEEVLAFPGVPRRWQRPSPETPLMPVIPVSFRKGSKTFAYFSTVTTLGTAQDVTLQELRIECFFPMDAETERNAKELARIRAGTRK